VIANSDIFTLDKNGKLTKKHIVKEILPKLLSVLDKADMIVEEDGDTIHSKVVIFLAYKDVLFEICSSFNVLQYEEFQAIGNGSNYAQGTMLNTKDTDDINERIVRALDIVSSYNYHVGRPYVLINSKDLQYKVKGDN
ncbi:MAG: hypothetical protein J6U92_04630, partial [Clostridia bacterium]|nr:hypothetical protein [Clostridia bacterium]